MLENVKNIGDGGRKRARAILEWWVTKLVRGESPGIMLRMEGMPNGRE